MDEREIIEHLCSKGHRGSGTTQERWAADEIEQMLTKAGLHTEIQDFRGHRTFGEKLLIHIIPALILSILSMVFTDLAIFFSLFIAVLVISNFIENTWFVDIASRIFPRIRSVNVLARERKDRAKRRILFVAHHDSQREGQMFNPWFINIMKGYMSGSSRITPIHLSFLAIAGLMISSATFSLELDDEWKNKLIFLHGALFLWGTMSAILVLQWALCRRHVPGANDNASGVAVMIQLARSISGIADQKNYEDTEFWYLTSGCEETGLGGALEFIRTYGRSLNEIPISVLCLDGFGYGNIHHFIADGMLLTRSYDEGLTNIAKEVMIRKYGVDRPFKCRVFTDGLAFSIKGYPTITFGSLDEDDIIMNYHWRTDTPENIDDRSVSQAREFLLEFVNEIIGSEHQSTK